MRRPTRLARTAVVVTACCGLLIAAGAATPAVATPAAAQPLATGRGPVIPDTCAQLRTQAPQLASQARARRLVGQGQLTVSCVQPAAVGTRTARNATSQSPVCGFEQWYYDRFDMCAIVAGEYYLYTLDPETGEMVETGDLTFEITHDIALSAVTSTFAESDEFLVTSAAGDADSGTTIALSVSCGGSCRATNHFEPSPVEDGSNLTGSVSYSDSTTTVDSTSSSYTWVFHNPIATNGPVSFSFGSLTYRCDDEVAAYPGCVVPAYTPTLTTMTLLPAIDANIASIQAAGPHHYGNPSYSPAYPLHRTTDPTIQNANNSTACPPSRKPRPGGSYPYVGPAPGSCDEYPFATTLEGASRTQKPDWGTAIVPPSEQSAQGGYISSFYQANRILDGDAFWVAV
ncbi:MAG: hypothetical protein JO345_24780 [Streptosporangiaceae bacterium]|nr:hypothetical protein [Streptosporangiaceae bacterium]